MNKRFKIGDRVIFKLDEMAALQSRDGVINRPGTIKKDPYDAGNKIRQMRYLVQDDHIGCNDIHTNKENWWVNEEDMKLNHQYYREKALNELGI